MKKTDWRDRLNSDPLPWLLKSNPWTRYRTLMDLMDEEPDPETRRAAKRDLLDHPQIQELIRETETWFPQSITRHNVATLSHYRLKMLADFGLDRRDATIPPIVDQIRKHRSGPLFAVRQTLPEKGRPMGAHDPDSDEWHAQPCDSPLITETLLRLGYDDAPVMASVEAIRDRWSDSKGWFCDFFFVQGQYKKLQIGCPMAGLMALQIFSLSPELKESECARNAFHPLKFHRDSGKSLYFFGRSNKFWTFKYPFAWYNALYLVDVLTRFDFLKEDPLVRELIDWILASQDESGRFRPTSMFMAYKSWDFGNKKEPSPWITYLCCRILKQYFG